MLKKLFITFILTCTSTLAWSQTAVEALDKQLSATHAFQAHFIQTTVSTQFGNQVTEGEMTLARPGKFRWQIENPDQQLLISDGKTLWVYDKDLEQVIIQPVSQRLDETPALLLAGEVESIQQFFNVSRISSSKPGQWYELKSRDNEGLVSRVILNFNQNVIKEMQIYDNLGQKTDIKFSNIKTNPNLPAHYFTFKTPKGVEVISENH